MGTPPFSVGIFTSVGYGSPTYGCVTLLKVNDAITSILKTSFGLPQLYKHLAISGCPVLGSSWQWIRLYPGVSVFGLLCVRGGIVLENDIRHLLHFLAAQLPTYFFHVLEREWPVEGAENDAVENNGAHDPLGTAPAILVYEQFADRGKYERTDSGPTRGNTGGESAFLVEIETNNNDGGKVHQPKTDS